MLLNLTLYVYTIKYLYKLIADDFNIIYYNRHFNYLLALSKSSVNDFFCLGC